MSGAASKNGGRSATAPTDGRAKTVWQLRSMAIAAAQSFARFERRLRSRVNEQRAHEIRSLRVVRKCTWREIGETISRTWGAELWTPRSDRVAGMLLCDEAAYLLGENPKASPWL